MSTAVSDVLNQIADHVQETRSFSTGFWSIPEIIGYLDNAQKEFILRTGYVKVVDDSTLMSAIGTRLYDEPADSMEIDRVAFGLVAPAFVALYRTNRFNLDRADKYWKQRSGTPGRYHQDQLANKEFELDKAPQVVGPFQFVYTQLPDTLETAADLFSVPDHCVPYLKYRGMDFMFSKEGEGQDLRRAAFCGKKFRMGINLFRRLVGAPDLQEQGDRMQ